MYPKSKLLDSTHSILTHIKQAAALFPLVFSIVVGRAMVKLASWKLERGASLGLLERLMGSRAVGGAIATQFRLYSLSLVAIVLVFLWLLSPLGSQAVLRILSRSTESRSSSGNVTYINTTTKHFWMHPILRYVVCRLCLLVQCVLACVAKCQERKLRSMGKCESPLFL